MEAPDPAVLPWQQHQPAWDAEADDMLVCRHIANVTHDVKTFVFSAREPRLFRFQPGQFLTLAVPVGAAEIQRCYTISSPPTRPDRVCITVKRIPGGPVSNWLHVSLAIGTQLRAAGPFGDFTCFSRPSAPYLFLSGGSGITPLMAMAQTHADLGMRTDTVFLHNARSPADIIFRQELAALAARNRTFKFVPVCEDDSPADSWHGYRGRISAGMLLTAVPDILARSIYTCGPTAYMQAVRDALQQIGFSMARYFQESFVFADAPPPEPAALTAPGFSIVFSQSQTNIQCPPTQTVLEAARAAGLKLPSSCTRGLCGTCKSTLLSGRVDMKHAGGIRPRDIERGQILICCSTPLTDLVIDR